MPDIIPPSDRRLIDEAIAAGRVTVCPPRTFAVPEPGVTLREQITADAMRAKVRFGKKPDPAVRDRRMRVLDLADGSKSVKEIAAIVGISAAAAWSDITELRRTGYGPKVKKRAYRKNLTTR